MSKTQEALSSFEKLQQALHQHEHTSDLVADALVALKKSRQLHIEALALVDEAIVRLGAAVEPPRSEEYLANVAAHPDAPFGRKLDGMPKLASGKQALKLRREQA